MQQDKDYLKILLELYMKLNNFALKTMNIKKEFMV